MSQAPLSLVNDKHFMPLNFVQKELGFSTVFVQFVVFRKKEQ